MISESSWEQIKRLGTVLGLLSTVVGVAFFFFNQNQRIGSLEAQMQAIVTAPLRWDSSRSGKSDEARAPQMAANPIAQLCAELGAKLAQGGTIGALDPTAITMDRLNCKAFAK